MDEPPDGRLQEGAALYKMFIGPLEPSLTRVHNWVVIPDGALDYVPFAALRVGDVQRASFVVMQHDVAVAPAASMLDTNRSAPSPDERRKILLVADPVYEADDPRLATAGMRSPPHNLRRITHPMPLIRIIDGFGLPPKRPLALRRNSPRRMSTN